MHDMQEHLVQVRTTTHSITLQIVPAQSLPCSLVQMFYICSKAIWKFMSFITRVPMWSSTVSRKRRID